MRPGTSADPPTCCTPHPRLGLIGPNIVELSGAEARARHHVGHVTASTPVNLLQHHTGTWIINHYYSRRWTRLNPFDREEGNRLFFNGGGAGQGGGVSAGRP